MTVKKEKYTMTTSSYESLSHSKWDCKYHLVFVPKNRKKVLYGKIRKYLGSVFHELAGQRGSRIINGNMVQDHVHMLIKISPKYSVAEVVGYIKGKAPYLLPDSLVTNMEKDYGPEATQFQPLVLKNLRFELT